MRDVRAEGESAVVGEAGLELLAGEEDAALDGAEGEVHLLGNLVVLEALNVHVEGNGVLGGKLGDG